MTYEMEMTDFDLAFARNDKSLDITILGEKVEGLCKKYKVRITECAFPKKCDITQST